MIYVQACERPEDIDKRRAEEAKLRAEERMRQKNSMQEYRRSKLALARAIARLRITRPNKPRQMKEQTDDEARFIVRLIYPLPVLFSVHTVIQHDGRHGAAGGIVGLKMPFFITVDDPEPSSDGHISHKL